MIGIFVGMVAALGGVMVVFAGLSQQRQAAGLADPGEYLRSLDYGGDETDEFQQLLAEPFITRVLRPLGSKLLGGFALALPGNYRETIHRKTTDKTNKSVIFLARL